MILANVAAAETLEQRARAADLSRARRAVAGEDRGAARNSWRRCTSRCRRAARCGAEQFNRILAQVKGQDVEKLVNEVVLRSQAQAEYAAENYGHFGLNLRRYAHFTSPIRRYADLIVHRGLIRAAELRRRRPARQPGRRGADRDRGADFGRRAPRHEGRARDQRPADRALSSPTASARASKAASRASPAPACSSSSTRPAPTASFRRAPSATNISATTRPCTPWSATASGETHRLGDRVTVKLVEAAPVAGALRFELLSEGRVMTGAQRRPSDRRRQAHRRAPPRKAVPRQEAVSGKSR